MARRNDKRERLIDAAAELFWARGFDATSLADIAGAAGVPLGNVYYYFKTKIDIARAVAELFVAQSEMLIHSLDEGSEEPAVKLRNFIDILAGSNTARTERGCPIARAITDFRRHDQTAADHAVKALALLTSWVEGTLRDLGAESPRRAAWRLISDWQGGIVMAHAFADQSHLESTIQAMRDTIRIAGDRR